MSTTRDLRSKDYPRSGPYADDRAPAFLAALVDAQPLPAFAYSADGRLIACGRAAAALCVGAGTIGPRVLADDGTDLWTIVSGRSEEADPLYELKVPLRTASSETTDATLAVIPLRGRGGTLGGALVIVTGLSDVGYREVSASRRAEWSGEGVFERLVADLGALTGADCVCLAEVVDPDDDRAGAPLIAVWERGRGRQAPIASYPAVGPALVRTLKGRHGVTVVDAGPDALSPDQRWVSKGLRSMACASVRSADGRPLGALAALWRSAPSDLTGIQAAVEIVGFEIAGLLCRLVTEQELKEAEQRYGAVYEGSATPIILIDPGTTQIVDANPAACSFYGIPHAEIVTMSVIQLDALSPDGVQRELARALDGSRSRFAGKHRAADGAIRDVEVSTGVITVAGRRLLYGMLNDITERLRMEAAIERQQRDLETTVAQRTEDLMRANAELQQATIVRDMVLASLNREVRTSLQTITGFTEIILGGEAGSLTEEQERQLSMVLDAGQHLGTFLGGLAESSRDDDAEARIDVEKSDLVALVESVVFGLASFAADKGLELAVVADERPVIAETDRYKVQKILLNLLSNAIRHTDRGAVTVTVMPDGPDGSMISVADTGPGIPQERLETLFADAGDREGVSGLTLSTSRQAAEAIGASIEVESAPGHGTIFTVWLPNHGSAR
ncbi:MAG: PAS domain-containing sensor histidine kinase [Aeromicrobium sp.]|nr:PAS domain-containing sensor histidine kinase [Aeromicrobium sp.]